MNRHLSILLSAIFVVTVSFPVFAANSSQPSAQTKVASVAGQQGMGAKKPARSNFLMMIGAVSNIDASDPAAVKVEVKDDRDGQTHTIEVTPSTNITKVTDISELKAGDAVRVMARRVNDKEIAVGIMYGNFKSIPPAAKLPPAQGKPAALKK